MEVGDYLKVQIDDVVSELEMDHDQNCISTNDKNPSQYSPDGSMTLPCSSTNFLMFSVARIDAVTIQIDARAIC